MSNWSDLKNNPRLKNIYDARINILRLIREFFWSQEFVETETPIGVRYAGQEPYLNPVAITIHDPKGHAEKFYLRTSPEYALKKLLAAGFGKIFELAKCFRDYESFGGNHNTEFTMLEWYRAPGTYHDFMDDMENLFKYIGENLTNPTPRPSPFTTATAVPRLTAVGGGIKGGVLRHKEREIDFSGKWDRLSMKEVWQKYLQADLDDYLEIEKLRNLAIERGFSATANDRYEDLFFKIFLNEIEPKLGLERPLFIYNFPAQMASLSRLCDHGSRYAERVECYIGGLEMCNGYGELTDAEEQQRRLEKDRELRAKLGKEIWPVDPDFINALAGLPAIAQKATAGVALGVDRMVLLFTGAQDLNEVIFQSIKDQINL